MRFYGQLTENVHTSFNCTIETFWDFSGSLTPNGKNEVNQQPALEKQINIWISKIDMFVYFACTTLSDLTKPQVAYGPSKINIWKFD